MKGPIMNAAYGCLIALAAFALVIVALWKPVIKPQLVRTAQDTGREAFNAFAGG